MSWLRPHQKEAIRKIHELKGCAGLFLDVGGGKTRVALAYVRWRKAKRILVVLPGYVVGVWQDELQKIGWTDTPVLDLTELSSTAARAKAIRSFGDGIIFVNYEGYWRTPLNDLILKWKPDACILDEVQRIRGRASKQSRFAGRLGKVVPIRLALSATPMTNGLQDAWSIFRFIDYQIFGRWPEFSNRYLVFGGFRSYSITAYNNVDEFEKIVSRNSFQWVGELPAAPDIPIYVKLSPATEAIYKKLKKEGAAELEESDGTRYDVLIRIALTQAIRLQQVTSGHTVDTDGQIRRIGTEKADATLELVQDLLESGQQIVIYCRFIENIDLLMEKLAAAKIRAARMQGGMDNRATQKAFDAGEYDVVVAQIRSVSLGIDLANASVGIFYSPGISFDDFLQAKGRLTGDLRQRHRVTFYHMIVPKSVDVNAYRNFTAKATTGRRVTKLRFALDFVQN